MGGEVVLTRETVPNLSLAATWLRHLAYDVDRDHGVDQPVAVLLRDIAYEIAQQLPDPVEIGMGRHVPAIERLAQGR
jgi:hypothetical protein